MTSSCLLHPHARRVEPIFAIAAPIANTPVDLGLEEVVDARG